MKKSQIAVLRDSESNRDWGDSIRVSHVGSFPLDYSFDNVRRILVDIYNVGVDVPPYPQLHNFIELYLKPLEAEGCIASSQGFFFSRNIECLLRTRIKIAEAEDTITVIKTYNLVFNALRAPITGPFTLASRVYMTNDISKGLSATYLAEKDVVLNIVSKFVATIVDYMASLGYSVIFIDEPAFTYIVGRRRFLFNYREEELIEVLDSITSAKPGLEFGIHICGKLNSKILEIVLQVPKIKYISIEIHDTPQNLDLIDRELFEKYDKFLSPGIVSAQKAITESIDEALSLLNLAYEKVGNRIDLISGDCGFRGLKGTLGNIDKEYEIALSKLRVIAEATKRFKNAFKLSSL